MLIVFLTILLYLTTRKHRESFITQDKSDSEYKQTKIRLVESRFSKKYPELIINHIEIKDNKAIVKAYDRDLDKDIEYEYSPLTVDKEGNEDTLRKMSCVYNGFVKRHPELEIIDTIKVDSDKYYVKTYHRKNNVSGLYEITGEDDKSIGVPFLLNEYDDNLNKLENSKELSSIKEYVSRY